MTRDGRIWWNGDRWSVEIRTGITGHKYRDATAAEVVAHLQPEPAPTPVAAPDVIVAPAAPVRPQLVARNGERVA